MKTNSLLVSVLVLLVGFACWIVRVTTPDLNPFPDRRGKRVSPTSSVRISEGQRDSGLSTASVYKGSHLSAKGSFVGSRGYHHGAGVGMISSGTASSISSVSMGGSAASSSFTLHTSSSQSVQSHGGIEISSSAVRLSGGSRTSSASNAGGSVSGLGGLSLPAYARGTNQNNASATAAASNESQRTTAAGMRSSLYTSRLSQNSGYTLLSNSPMSSSDNLSNLNNLYNFNGQLLLANNSNSNIGRRKMIDWSDKEGDKYYDDEKNDYVDPPTYPNGTSIDPSNPPTIGKTYSDGAGNWYTWNGSEFIYSHSEMTPAPVGDGAIALLLMASAMMAVTYFGRRRKQEAVA